jgi:hypothetical protein
MLLATPPASRSRIPSPHRVTLKASRPALTDLRFKGDAWVVGRGHVAAVCLGDYPLGHVAVSPLDLPSLNRTLEQVRTGQARRNHLRRVHRAV